MEQNNTIEPKVQMTPVEENQQMSLGQFEEGKKVADATPAPVTPTPAETQLPAEPVAQAPAETMDDLGIGAIEVPEPTSQPTENAQPNAPAQTENKPMFNPAEFSMGDFSEQSNDDIQLKEEDSQVMGEGDKSYIISNKEFIIESAESGSESLNKRILGGEVAKPFSDKEPEKVGYTTYLRIKYKDSSYISIIPKIRWYAEFNNEGQMTGINPWFRTKITEKELGGTYIPAITKLYYKVCIMEGVEPGKLSAKNFVEALVGKRVVLEQWKNDWNGKTNYRLDIYKLSK